MNILFVCTGNICRSPLAEQVFAQLLEAQSSQTAVPVDSAGTYAVVAAPMNSGSVAAMESLGFEPQAHSAKQLTRQLVEWANLVLTFEEGQRTDVVELLPRANKYTFTLLEFANLIALFQSAAPDLDSRLAETLLHRGMVQQLDNLDIADPYGKDAAAFEAMANLTRSHLQEVVAWLP